MTCIAIHVDRDLCSGAGACALAAPGAFGLDGDGVALPTGAPAATTVLEAARSYPMGAIRIASLGSRQAL